MSKECYNTHKDRDNPPSQLNREEFEMHESMERLHKVSGLIKKKDIAEKMGVAQSSVTNWVTRGLSHQAAIQAAEIWNVDANYILRGDEVNKAFTDDLTKKSNSNKYKHHDRFDLQLHINEMPVFSKVSIDSYIDSKNAESWIEKPSRLSASAFALIVAGRSMQPEFGAGEIVRVETDITIDDLKDGNFVVVQHSSSDYAVIKQVIVGDNASDMYLTQLNKDLPDFSIDKMSDYKLIGIIDSKITLYR